MKGEGARLPAAAVPLAAYGLITLALLVTLGEGGAYAGVLWVWHGWLVVLLLYRLLLPQPESAVARRLSRSALFAFSLLLAVVLVGAWAAPYRYGAWLLLLELGAFLATGWLAASFGPALLRKIELPLLAAAALQGAWAIWQRLGGGVPRPAATFLNPNHLGGWLAAVLLLVWGRMLVSRARTRSELLTRMLLSLPVVVAFAFTESRGGMLTLAAGATALGLFAWRGLGRRERWAVATALLVLVLFGGWIVQQRLREPDPFLYQRTRIWRASIAAALESPWRGTGPRQFEVASRNLQFPDGDGPLRYDRVFRSTHSDLVRSLAEFGWPGAAALLLAGLVALGRVRARLREDESTAVEGAAAAALIGLLAQAAVSNVSQRPALYILGAVLLGSLLSEPGATGGRLPYRHRATLAVLLVAVFLFGDLAPYAAWSESSALPRGRLDHAGQQRLDRALRLNPIHPDLWLRQAEHLAGAGTDWNLASYARARESAERAARLSPLDSRYRQGLARIDALACRTLLPDRALRERAREQFLLAEALARFDPFVPLELARFLLDTGDPVGARRAAERALALEPEAASPRLVLAGALLADGTQPSARTAIRLIEEAQQLSQRWEAVREHGPYSREMLHLDPRAIMRLREALESERASP